MQLTGTREFTHSDGRLYWRTLIGQTSYGAPIYKTDKLHKDIDNTTHSAIYAPSCWQPSCINICS